jgi:hypothetical protein
MNHVGSDASGGGDEYGLWRARLLGVTFGVGVLFWSEVVAA